MSAHYGDSYFNPHPDTYLAFIARGVHLLCEAPKRTLINDPNRALLFETYNRQTASEIFSNVTPAQIDFLVGCEIVKAQQHIAIVEMREFIRAQAMPRPPKGSKRREVPAHQPLRPHTQIVAGTLMRLRAQLPGITTNKLWNNAAKLLNDGLATRDQSQALAVRNIRTPDEAFWRTDAQALKQAIKRSAQSGGTHRWDRYVVEFDLAASRLVPAPGNPDERARVMLDLINRDVVDVLAAIDRIYREARSDERFRRLVGVKLADQVDALEGFERTVDKLMIRPLFAAFGLPESRFIANFAA